MLSIVTLGIYSAWATVRNKNYLYGHTKIDGHAFSYLAKPLQILKGRIFALILFASYAVLTHFYPITILPFILLFIVLFPWLIVKGLAFRLRMTSYRNVRFDFLGTYKETFVTFILFPLVGFFTIYLAMPWALKKIDEYVLSNTSYGQKQVTTYIETSKYYLTVLLTVLVGIVAVVAVMAFMFASAAMDFSTFFGFNVRVDAVFIVVYLPLLLLIKSIYKVRIRNHIFNSSEFSDLAEFKSDMRIVPYTLLQLTNVLAIVCSLGLAYPWAEIRTARYLAFSTQARLNEHADTVLDTMSERQSAFCDEAADAFDIDISAI